MFFTATTVTCSMVCSVLLNHFGGSGLRCIASIRGVWPDARCYWLAYSWYPSPRTVNRDWRERGGCCGIQPIHPSTSEGRTRMRRLWISALWAFVFAAERTWTGKICDNRVTWTEEEFCCFALPNHGPKEDGGRKTKVHCLTQRAVGSFPRHRAPLIVEPVPPVPTRNTTIFAVMSNNRPHEATELTEVTPRWRPRRSPYRLYYSTSGLYAGKFRDVSLSRIRLAAGASWRWRAARPLALRPSRPSFHRNAIRQPPAS
jgi:hypothetical protein